MSSTHVGAVCEPPAARFHSAASGSWFLVLVGGALWFARHILKYIARVAVGQVLVVVMTNEVPLASPADRFGVPPVRDRRVADVESGARAHLRRKL